MDVIRQALKMVHLVDWVMHDEIFIGNTNKIYFFFGMDTITFPSQKQIKYKTPYLWPKLRIKPA